MVDAKNIIFFTDLDGTLEDSRTDMLLAVTSLRKNFNLPSRPQLEFEPHVIKGMEHLYRNCFSELWLPDYKNVLHGICPEAKAIALPSHPRSDEATLGGILPPQKEDKQILAAIQPLYDARYLEGIANHTQLYPGIPALFKGLAQINSKIVVVTNKPTQHATALLSALGLLPFVTLVMGGDSCEKTKPDPLPLTKACQHLKIESKDALSFMMGDSLADVQVAQSFGAHSIWCTWGYAKSCHPLVPEFQATYPLGVLEFVEKVFESC